jgi:hypothetical protein
MHVEWFGQSAFALTGSEAAIFIDPFGDLSPLAQRGMQFDYPPIQSGVEWTCCSSPTSTSTTTASRRPPREPAILRSTAGRLDSPIGEVVAIASEHDEQAGTQRGPNTILFPRSSDP